MKLHGVIYKACQFTTIHFVSIHPQSTPQELCQLSLLSFVNPKILTSSISCPLFLQKYLSQQGATVKSTSQALLLYKILLRTMNTLAKYIRSTLFLSCYVWGFLPIT